eukprot:XP_001707632.1 Hypothetical protein GL50803_39128 [Giardia lamblia ATCC 50803]
MHLFGHAIVFQLSYLCHNRFLIGWPKLLHFLFYYLNVILFTWKVVNPGPVLCPDVISLRIFARRIDHSEEYVEYVF